MRKPAKSKGEKLSQTANLLPLWETEARSGPKMEARAHMLEAAAHAFMERGYAAATLDHVAKGLGTTKGQIYHYYRSKSDLFFDVVVGAYFIVNERTNPIFETPDLTPAELLRRIIHAHAMAIMNTFAYQRVALEATQHQLVAKLNARQNRAMERVTKFRNDYENRISDIIARGMESGDFARANLKVATKAALGSLHWLIVWYDPNRSSRAATQHEIAASTAAFVISGLRGAPADYAAEARAAVPELGLEPRDSRQSGP